MGEDPAASARPRSLLGTIGPGLLVAATGVGAGDLATGAIAGGRVGVSVLWAVLVGAVLKVFLTEGLARWQLATGTTLLAGAVAHLGRGVAWVFLPYLFVWSFFVGGALVSACGIAAHAIVVGVSPGLLDVATGKVVFGVGHSLVGLLLVQLGGFRLFERVMSVCIGVMFLTVVVTAAALWPGTGVVLRGCLPNAASLTGDALTWTVALLGGVGGTVTLLCYGYWIQEEGRTGLAALRLTRIDLAVGYTMTAVFGVAMVVVGAAVGGEGKGARLIVDLAEKLEGPLGSWGKWAFLLGAWGAVFSSLLGVWQAIPYLFADFWLRVRPRQAPAEELPAQTGAQALTRSALYRGYLVALALVPLLGLAFDFVRAQRLYAVFGACFLPLLAVGLLLLNGRRLPAGARNGPLSVLGLIATLLFFGAVLLTKAASWF